MDKTLDEILAAIASRTVDRVTFEFDATTRTVGMQIRASVAGEIWDGGVWVPDDVFPLARDRLVPFAEAFSAAMKRIEALNAER